MIVPPSLHATVEINESLEAGAKLWWRPVAAGAWAVLAVASVLAVIGVVPALAGRVGPAATTAALAVAAALFVAGVGLVPAAVVLHSRAGGERALGRLTWLGGWPQAALAAVLAEAAIAAAVLACRTVIGIEAAGAGAVGASPAPVLVGAVVAALGFPVLVFERHLTTAGPAFPEAAMLIRFLRLPLLALTGAGLALVATGAGYPVALWLVLVLAGLTGAIAAETLLRAVARLFVPPVRGLEVRALAEGTLAAVILDPTSWGGQGGLGATLVDRFGIDLSRSWALGFVRGAVLPLAFGLALVAWGVTALTALRPDQRGVYERLGAPVAVFGPGLSVHLPWPFGIVRPTEYGTVHQLAVVLLSDGATPAAIAGGPIRGTQAGETADGPAPTGADRLWVEAHPSEVSYLVPGAEAGRGAFELVDLDLRLVYRIGMTDRAAIAAQTAVSDPETLIRAYAGAWLVRTFSTRTLPGLLREDTSRLQQEMATALQRDLDEAGSGLELLGVVIDAIHPPPGAASAYHGVQAAEIRAAAELARERRAAVTITGEAREKATMTLNLAAANAEQMKANAAIDRVRFLADVQAQREAGNGVTLDRRLEVLERSLAGGALTIVDHRISLSGETVLDFRNFAAGGPAASDAADADIPVDKGPSSDAPVPHSGAPESGAPPSGASEAPGSGNPEEGR